MGNWVLDVGAVRYRLVKKVLFSVGWEPDVTEIEANAVSKLDVEVREEGGIDIFVEDNPEPDAILEEADPELD